MSDLTFFCGMCYLQIRLRVTDGVCSPRDTLVTVNVERSLFAPVWQPNSTYVATVLETHDLLSPVKQVSAFDRDLQVNIGYQ